MLQPATAWMTCSVCNASYDSQTKLREHRRVAHRDMGSQEARAPHQQPFEITFGPQDERTMEKVLVQLRNHFDSI